ncbi:glycoside hydrolase family 3 N-terminal domain-containing protein [Coraliomargarita algicola]|uniref:beta-N-acetylhexosaminidase n=1 Tax=Coraliomargarita algicola TaxID=3092156 RepID=A0ABZ0RNP0_9BACT|nr:glycoside hydrolase family 3 N-terminal domain-containing protein [Coraliomargarita sp. J2-16]WPJ97845.1 glycoside hydrolase family 3 N-terminal domain-containing protein [Coraliomargarita sp. J2-16]
MTPNPLELSPIERNQVVQIIEQLEPRERLAQLIHPILWAHWNPESPVDAFHKVSSLSCGGGFLGVANLAETSPLLRDLQQRSKVPLLISGDHESGCRAVGATSFGSLMNLAAVEPIEDAEKYAYQVAAETARQARSMGCHWNFGPVVDINYNWDNPITNHRSFGDNPHRIARLAQAYIRGMQEHGIAATAKHFPGDGMDSRDQHTVTSVNTLPLNEWEQSYGQTFKAAIDAGVMSIMTGWIAMLHRSSLHVRTGLRLPAVIDPAVQIDLLRSEMGFKGLVVTDAFKMGGLRAIYPDEGELAVEALRAGADMLLFIRNSVESTVDAIECALNDGRLNELAINRSVERIISMKAKLGLLEAMIPLPDEDIFSARVDNPKTIELSSQVGERSVTLVRDWASRYPLNLPKKSRILLVELGSGHLGKSGINVGENDDKTLVLDTISRELEGAGYEVDCARIPADVQDDISAYDAVFYISNISPRPQTGSVRISSQANACINWEAMQAGQPAYFVSFGNPYLIREIGVVDNYVCCYSRQPNVVIAYTKALLGQIQFRGKCPVDLMLW